MTFRTLIWRSLRLHFRANAAVAVGAAIGSMALTGALIVGDSIHGTLRERALQRLGYASYALAPGDRLFTPNLRWSLGGSTMPQQLLLRPPIETDPDRVSGFGNSLLLELPGTASVPFDNARANHVHVFGATEDYLGMAGGPKTMRFSPGSVVLNSSLAAKLGAKQGDEILLRIEKPTALPFEAAISRRQDSTTVLRLRMAGILMPEEGGNLDLRAGGEPPLNAFVSQEELYKAALGHEGMNLMLTGPLIKRVPYSFRYRVQLDLFRLREWLSNGKAISTPHTYFNQFYVPATTPEALGYLQTRLHTNVTMADVEARLKTAPGGKAIELRTPRVFLDPAMIETALKIESNAIPILTYLANLLTAGTNAVPYSMVTASGPPYTPADMKDDEILINQWLADELHARPGERVQLSYFLPESGAKLTEVTNDFRVRAIVPLEGIYSDRTLMPDFPGIENAESTRDWDAGFPLAYKIRPADEDYWKRYRGTPKAFVTIAAGKKMWANRFGSLTAIRMPDKPGQANENHWNEFNSDFLASLNPEAIGMKFMPVREQALNAADQAQDFGQLFLGFSIFLVAGALMLTWLLFQFSLEARSTELGTLLAMGFLPGQVRRMLMGEGAMIALVAGGAGSIAGLGYAKAMLWALAHLWQGAVGSGSLNFHAAPITLIIGVASSAVVALITLWLALRKQARQPARELLEGKSDTPGRRRRFRGVATGSAVLALCLAGWALASGQSSNVEVFFSAGSLLLISGIGFSSWWFGSLGVARTRARLTLDRLAIRGGARRRKRSVATVALLASGSFVILAIGVFRLDANSDAGSRSSGTGGFALIGESTMPIVRDLNTSSGREAYGLGSNDLANVQFVALRVHDGDEASCLNLNRAQQPRLLGVGGDPLKGRFTFTEMINGHDLKEGWNLLKSAATGPGEIPAIGDANSIEWALGRKIGDTLDYTDEHGQSFRLRLVGAVANSILQGSLIIDEEQFVKKFPGESGHRMFLIDAPSNSVAQVSSTLSRTFQDAGLELTRAPARLNAFNAVQNTYLGAFQILGGLGLLLGSAGLGVVVLRNVMERRGELGLLLAEGFQKQTIARLVLTEHVWLLCLGLAVGGVAAAVAVLPTLLSPGMRLPSGSLALTLLAVVANGLVWAWLATRHALRGNLLESLRNE
jgi:ABC-type antimicrobial peptide transport system permease subunit